MVWLILFLSGFRHITSAKRNYDNMSLSELSDINDCFVTSDAIFLANYECCCNARASDIIKLARLLNKNESSSLVTDPRWASVKRYDPNGYKMVRLLKTLGLISLPYCVTFDIWFSNQPPVADFIFAGIQAYCKRKLTILYIERME